MEDIEICVCDPAKCDVMRTYFEEYLAETERVLANNDQRGFYSDPRQSRFRDKLLKL